MEEIWFSAIWHKACFDVWTFQSDGRYGAPRSRVSMTPAASPTPTPAQAQRAEDQASSGGTCCKFFLPTRRPHEGSHVSGASPDTTVFRNMGQGRPGLGARAFGRCVGKEPMGGVEQRNFADGAEAKCLFGCLHSSSGFTGCCWGLWTAKGGSVEFLFGKCVAL